MRVVTLTTHSTNGGAALVASTLSSALRAYCDNYTLSQDVICADLSPFHSAILSALFRLRRKIGRIPSIISRLEPDIYKSYSLLPSSIPSVVNKLSPDIVHIHWIQGEFLSIEDISRINAPIIWTLHDCWPFSSSEHHHLTAQQHYRDGYCQLPWYSLDKLTYLRKRLSYCRSQITFVAPSKWIQSKAQSSRLLENYNIFRIPNPVNLSSYYPANKQAARDQLGLSSNLPIFLAGSMTTIDDRVKGFDLLSQSLLQYKAKYGSFTLLRIGNPAPLRLNGINEINLGRLNSPSAMRTAYSSADVTCVPSRIETHSQTAAESIACGTPVVAFDVAGNSDVVSPGHSGTLVPPFNTNLYCDALYETYRADTKPELIASIAQKWESGLIASMYLNLYRDISNSR